MGTARTVQDDGIQLYLELAPLSDVPRFGFLDQDRSRIQGHFPLSVYNWIVITYPAF